MANLFTIIKTFRPYRKILSADFNASLLTLKASFDKLGTAPPDGKTGVSTPFWVGTATEANHAASKGTLDILDAATTSTLDTDRAATATTLSAANAAQVAQIDAYATANTAAVAALNDSIQADVAATAADRSAIAASLAAVDSFPALAAQVAGDATQTAADRTAASASAAAAASSEANAASTLSTLTDVTIGTPTKGQTLSYDAATNKWVNRAAGGVSAATLLKYGAI